MVYFLSSSNLDFFVSLLLTIVTATSINRNTLFACAFEGTVQNFRAVSAQENSPFYRCASLESLSVSDAKDLLEGTAFSGDMNRPLAAVIDLRNTDEIEKSNAKHSDGANLFYSSLAGIDSSANADKSPRLYNVPLLADVDAFWDEAISRLNPLERMQATLKTAFVGGALDRAAARNLEKGGLEALYTIMAEISSYQIGQCLKICLRESERGVVLFHCQKGKDRTGLIAMLIQSCLGSSDEEIIDAYGISGGLIGEEDGPQNESRKTIPLTVSSGFNGVDWSLFRGSPRDAMAGTLDYIRQKYGSLEQYLEVASFGSEEQILLKKRVSESRKVQAS